MAKPVTNAEKQICVTSANRTEFIERYTGKFGFPSPASRLDTMWGKRKLYKEELVPASKNLTSTTQLATQKPTMEKDSLEILVDVANRIAESNVLLKELISLGHEANIGQQRRLQILERLYPSAAFADDDYEQAQALSQTQAIDNSLMGLQTS